MLATWELTARPGVTGLLAVMSRFRGLDELALLGRVADSPGIAVVPGLRNEVQGVLRKARDPSSIEPEFRQHVSDVVGKTSLALTSYVDEQRKTLQRDLLESASRLSRADREGVFKRLWKDAGRGAGGRLDQVRAIDDARELLDSARKAMGSGSTDPGARKIVADDPAAIADARQHLETLISQGEQTLGQASAAPPIARELLETLLADARSTLQTEQLSLRTLADQSEILELLAKDLGAEGFAAAFMAPSPANEGTGGGASKEQRNIVAELRRAIASSTEGLTRSAAALPTAQVIRFRTRLSEAEAAAHSDDYDAMQRLLAELREDCDEMGRLAQQQQRFEEDRNAAESDKLADEIENLATVAQGRNAKQLQTLKAKLKQRKNKAGIAAALPVLAARIANSERVALATLLRRASRCPEKARGQMQAELDDGAKALAGEDLVALRDAGSSLRQTLGKVAPWRGPRGQIAAGVLFAAILAGGWFGWQTMRNDATNVSFQFESAAGSTNVKFILVRGGEIVKELNVAPQDGVDVSLSAGRYEIFIDGRYTGRVVRVPQDVKSIEPIKVPR